ncbi:MAG: hypothetical protein ACRD4O_09905 [Bryobacteraceae bacterium]
MRSIYGWLWRKGVQVPTPVAIVLGLLITPLAVPLDKVPAARPLPAKHPTPAKPDPRAVRLQRFLARMHSPVAPLSTAFVHEADANHLDWRLLPSISVVESSGGKYCRNNNIFGWNGGNTVFSSVKSGIHEVAYRLGRSRLYKNRNLVGKLRLYNSEDGDYTQRVLGVMQRISPLPALPQIRKPAPPTELAYAN